MPDRSVEFEILAKDKSGPAVRAAAGGLEKLGDKSDEAKRQLSQLERETGQLRNKMLETAAAAKLLGHEFAKTGDSKVLKDFEKMTREADRLGRVLKKIEAPKLKVDTKTDSRDTVFRALFGGVADAAQQAGQLAGKTVINTFGDAFKAIPSSVKLGIVGAITGAAVLAGPFIAAAVEGAVLAGVAGGGIAAGLILAAKDPRIVDAYTGLGQSIMRELQDAAKPFSVELLQAAPELSSAFERQAPRIRATLATLAESVTPLVRGAAGFADNIAPGLQRAAVAGAKIVSSLARQLPALGAAVGHLLDAMAQAGPAASQALKSITDDAIVLIHTLALGAEAAAPLLNGLAKFDSLVNPISGLNRAGNDTVTWVERSSHAAEAAAQDYALLAQSLGNTANQADALNTAIERLFNATMNLDQANLAVKQGYLALRDSVKENGKSLDDSTAKGQANVGAILSQVQALDTKRQAEIAAGNGTKEATDKANAAYAANVAALRQVLINLGFTAGAVDNLIGKYAAIPGNITTTVTTVYRTEGTPARGNSRYPGINTSALDGWAPARFAEGQRLALAAAADSGTSRTGGPVQVSSTVENRIFLDGRPFREYTDRAVAAESRRLSWRAKVGRR